MGEGSRAAWATLGSLALVLAAGCASAASPPRALLPLPSTSASLTTTRPGDAVPPSGPEYVDPSLAEPPGAVPSSDFPFVWSRRIGPSTPFGPVDAAELRRIADTDLAERTPRPDLALALTLSGLREARAVAEQVRERLPRSVTRHEDGRDAVVLLGRTVVVRGVRTRARHTVRELLGGYGGPVLVEGDRYGEGAIVTDLSCRPSEPGRAKVVAEDLDDYAGTPHDFHLRPPWVRPRLSDAERLARSTYRRFTDAVERAAAADPETIELWFRYRQALRAGDTEKMEEVSQRIGERRRELAPRRLSGPFDRRTLRSLRAEPMSLDGRTGWAARVGRRMGQLPLTHHESGDISVRSTDSADAPALLTVRLGERLDVSMFLPDRHFAPSLATLVLHLQRAGCTDLRYRLLDWDTVRGD